MKLLNRMERRFGRFALPHTTEGLIACQVLTYFLMQGQSQFLEKIDLIPLLVLKGEIWRLITFVCMPPPTNAIFAFFFWYMFYLMGTALEATWGTFRYNVYLLTGYLATVAVSFLQPGQPASIGFLQGSVFLAFAYLFPEFEILLFFILPVKIKWLGLIQWIGYGYVFLFGDWWGRLLVFASVCNFFLFFWHDIFLRMKSGRRHMAKQATKIKTAKTPRHVCSICGANNLTHPDLSFRYCSKCDGGPCYCTDHIQNHTHVTKALK